MAAFGSTTRATLHHRMEAANAAAAREARAREAMAVLTASGAGADGVALLAAGLAVNVTKTEVEKIPFIDLDVHLDFDQPVHVWIDCLTGIATLADDVERFLFLMEPEAITGVAAQLVTKNLAGRFRAIFTHDAEILRALPHARRFEHGGTWVPRSLVRRARARPAPSIPRVRRDDARTARSGAIPRVRCAKKRTRAAKYSRSRSFAARKSARPVSLRLGIVSRV